MIAAKARVVTIVLTPHLIDRLCRDLKTLGVSGFTTTKADGFGLHGDRRHGLFDAPNVRVETIVSPPKSLEILELLSTHYEGAAYVAFAHDVDAIPHGHFEKKPPEGV